MDGAVRVPERFGHLPGTLRSPSCRRLAQPLPFPFRVDAPPTGCRRVPHHAGRLRHLRWRKRPGIPGAGTLARAPRPWFRCIVREFTTRVGTAGTASENRGFGAAQAFVFSPEAVKRYLRNRHICRHRWRSVRDGLTQIDVLLGWWAWWYRVPVWFPTPSLVQHVGQVSTLWLDNRTVGRRAANLFVANRENGERSAEVPPGPLIPQQ